jgi:hypothetical protein
MSSFDSVDFFPDTSLLNDPSQYFEDPRKTGPAVVLTKHPISATSLPATGGLHRGECFAMQLPRPGVLRAIRRTARSIR